MLLKRTDTLSAVSLVVNTTRGNLVETVPAKQRTPPTLVMPKLVTGAFSARSETSNTVTEGAVTVPVGWKVVSCGAYVHWNVWAAPDEGVPLDERTCLSQSKVHGSRNGLGYDFAWIETFAVAVYDPRDELWEVTIRSATSAPSLTPCQTVQLPNGYTLTGGGAAALWTVFGQLLTSSSPSGSAGWTACSEAHDGYAEVVSVTAYVIGLRPKNGLPAPEVKVVSATGARANQPTAQVSIGSDYVLVGGGAADNWRGYGNMLTAFCVSGDTFVAAGKAHWVADPATITVYAIGLKKY